MPSARAHSMLPMRTYLRNALRGWSLGTLLLVAVLAAGATASAGDWANWRGPAFNGSADDTGLPDHWGPGEGVLWTADLPGPGSSTPAVWGDRIFLTAADRATGEVLDMALNAADGAVLWQHGHGKNRRMGNNDLTSPSPVTDGQRVVFMFSNGEMVAYDYGGTLLWRRDLVEDFGVLSWNFGYGGSPLLHEGKLYVQMMRRSTHRAASPDKPLESFLLAIDPATGKDLWRHVREANAVGESYESYVTPVPFSTEPGAPILLMGGNALTAHDPQDGRELWRCTYNERQIGNWRVIPTPVGDGRRVYFALPRGSSFAAVTPGGPSEPVSERAAWAMVRNAPDVCSPLLYAGRLYVLDGDRRTLTCLDPATGDQVWQGTFEGNTVMRASPTGADGKVYCMDERGNVFVVAAADEFKVLARIDMGGGTPARSSVVVAGGRLYVRTASALHCIGRGPMAVDADAP